MRDEVEYKITFLFYSTETRKTTKLKLNRKSREIPFPNLNTGYKL